MSSALTFKSIAELAALLEAKTLSAVELTQATIARTKAVDAKVKAFNSFDEADALAQAAASDARRAAGQARGPLEGIPVGLKDVIAVAGQPLTASSKMLANFVSPYDATVTRKLQQAGAVLWGRLNLDEFAMGSSTENSAFHTTCNPWDLTRVPGGSSGGSAAAVAAGEAVVALGSDTGGSIRQPAALCGVVGFKPSYGLVSRYGLIAFASSLDQIGPLSRTVEDAAITLGAIAGHDPLDSTSFKTELPDYRAKLRQRGGPWQARLAEGIFRRRARSGGGPPPCRPLSIITKNSDARSRKCRCRTRNPVSTPITSSPPPRRPRISRVTMAFVTAIVRKTRKTPSIFISSRGRKASAPR